jgi:DNA replication protein DnaC
MKALKESAVEREVDAALSSLHLPAIKAVWKETSRKAQKEAVPPATFLLELLMREVENRRQNRVERLLRQSRLPLEKSQATYDHSRLGPTLSRQVKVLMEGTFVGRRENVLCFGAPGSGKTHLLCAVAQELVQMGMSIHFTTCSLLVQELLLAKSQLQLPKAIRRLRAHSAILIDDIGYVQQSREEMEVLFTLLAECYERVSLLITSNLPFSKWEVIFKDPMTTAAAIDRLIHHSVILELQGPSYRMEKAKARKEAEKTAKA